MKKLKRTILVTAAMSMAMTGTSLAAWKNGTGENQDRWRYDNGNETYASNGWQWIDGNGDGVAECYYFDANGWLMVNTTTPDGYTVNQDGAWVENGNIKTKGVSVPAASIGESDFVVSGNNSVTRNNADCSIITNWVRIGYDADPMPYHVFVTGDSLTTARGIALGALKKDVLEKYGTIESHNYNTGSDKWFQFMVASGNAEAGIISQAVSVLDYYTNPYGIRFYFNGQEQLTGVVYYRDAAAGNNNVSTNYAGGYEYSGGASYLYNSRTGDFKLHAETADSSEDQWFDEIYPADAVNHGSFTIVSADGEKFLYSEFGESYQFINSDGKWFCDENADNVLQEAEKNADSYFELLEDGRVSLSTEMDFDYHGESDNVNSNYGWPDKGRLKITAFYSKIN